MTEYARQFDGIQASFALHAGNLLDQYSSFANPLPTEDQYEGTLAICVLQALLTNCSELLKYMRSGSTQKDFFNQVIGDDPKNAWGLQTSFISQNTFPDSNQLTLRSLLVHMRDAVSHPSVVGAEAAFTPTGYTTTNDRSKRIKKFQFTDSPWVKDGKRHPKGPLPLRTANEARDRIRRFHPSNHVDEYLEVLPQSEGTFEIALRGKSEMYWPIFQIELELPVLVELARSLANHLAQHTIVGWDKKSVQQLVGWPAPRLQGPIGDWTAFSQAPVAPA